MQIAGNKINPSHLVIAISVIILLVGLGYLNIKRQTPEFGAGTTAETDKPDSEAIQEEENLPLPQSQNQTITPTTSKPEQSKNTLTRQGILLASDNPTRGNLMLKTPTSNFYFRTSRDYASLLGKSVTATGNGTTEQFILIDITENK